jgi:hypothetical protein
MISDKDLMVLPEQRSQALKFFNERHKTAGTTLCSKAGDIIMNRYLARAFIKRARRQEKLWRENA